MKKFEGLFSLQLGDVLGESKFKIISKELRNDEYSLDIFEYVFPSNNCKNIL